MSVDLGWIVYVRVNSSFEYVFEEFGFGVFTVSQAGKVDVEECRAACKLNTLTSTVKKDLHVTEVEEADVSQINRLGMKHLLRTHGEGDAVDKPTSYTCYDTRTDPRVSTTEPNLPT